MHDVMGWKGAITALITPFDADGRVDRGTLSSLAEWQVASGIDGLVPCGTTGEAATLDDEEHRAVIETVVAAVAGRVPVIAGCGSNDTRRTVAAALRAVEAGADGLLVVSPYYNKPNRSGMRDHYRAVCEAAGKPVVVYNVPGRTGQNLGARTILELAEIEGVAGVKEASADLAQIAEIVAGRPPGFAVWSGDDVLSMATMALGADGVISVVANEAPAETHAMMRACLDGDYAAARAIHYRLMPLMQANFVESNPVPVKIAVELLGRAPGRVRPPLGQPEPSTREALRRALVAAGLL